MDETLPRGFEWDNGLRLGTETEHLTKLVWPNYLVEPSDIPETAMTFQISQAELIRRMPVWGIRRTADRRLVANASALAIPINLEAETLPNEGWTFAMRALGENARPNALCLIAANVDPDFRNLGFSKQLLIRAKSLAKELGFGALIGPVRPVQKFAYPDLSFAEFLELKSEDNESVDPWIRLHERMGGERLNICSESVMIQASLQRWTEWTDKNYPVPGLYELPHGLAMLDVDVENRVGCYVEPNVWFRYRL